MASGAQRTGLARFHPSSPPRTRTAMRPVETSPEPRSAEQPRFNLSGPPDSVCPTTPPEGFASRDTARAMSQENVEIVRRSTDAYNRRDFDRMLESWAPDAVLDWSNARSFDAGVYQGHGEIRAFTEGFVATWDEVWIGDRQ